MGFIELYCLQEIQQILCSVKHYPWGAWVWGCSKVTFCNYLNTSANMTYLLPYNGVLSIKMDNIQSAESPN